MKNWFAAIGDQRVGPMTLEELGQKIATGQVPPSAMVWQQGTATWRKVSDVPELASLAAPSFSGTGMVAVAPGPSAAGEFLQEIGDFSFRRCMTVRFIKSAYAIFFCSFTLNFLLQAYNIFNNRAAQDNMEVAMDIVIALLPAISWIALARVITQAARNVVGKE